MRQTELDSMSAEQLVEKFAEIGVAQYDAELDLDTRQYNRLYDQMTRVSQELKHRTGDERRRLSVLYKHPNIQVRLKAAIHTLAVRPEGALSTLREVAEKRGYPQSGDALGMLRALDEGRFVPE